MGGAWSRVGGSGGIVGGASCRVGGAGGRVGGGWSRLGGAWSRVGRAGCRLGGSGCRVGGAGCRVGGAGCRVGGAWCRVGGAGLRFGSQSECDVTPSRYEGGKGRPIGGPRPQAARHSVGGPGPWEGGRVLLHLLRREHTRGEYHRRQLFDWWTGSSLSTALGSPVRTSDLRSEFCDST